MLQDTDLIKFTITNNHFQSQSYSCIVTGVFKGSRLFPSTIQIDKISQGYITSLLQRNLFDGSIDQNLLLYDAPYFLNKQILLIGCGEEKEFNLDRYIQIIKQIIKFCKRSAITKILILLTELHIKGYSNYWKIRHTATLFNNAYYTFYHFKSDKNKFKKPIYEVELYIDSPVKEIEHCTKAVHEALCIARGINIAKDLSNMPPNYCTPVFLSDQVKKLSNEFYGCTIEILDKLQLKKLGMNAYLSVGQGSSYSPVMPIIKYQHHPLKKEQNPIVLIGKGLTFDSGGISIKPADNMDEMKYDMCGAAVVYSIMYIVTQLHLPLNIIGVLAISENMINSKSLRPGDIITTLSGQTIEILNTDAEGRLVLCDALSYVNKYRPSIVIDIATLTGACVIALGHHFTGLMSNNDKLAQNLIQASEQTQDYVWRLPLHKSFEKQLQSTCADITNVGGKSGSVITAACFLNKFVQQQYDWAHLDIAGTAWISNDKVKSSTGRPVELLTQFLINMVNKEKTM